MYNLNFIWNLGLSAFKVQYSELLIIEKATGTLSNRFRENFQKNYSDLDFHHEKENKSSKSEKLVSRVNSGAIRKNFNWFMTKFYISLILYKFVVEFLEVFNLIKSSEFLLLRSGNFGNINLGFGKNRPKMKFSSASLNFQKQAESSVNHLERIKSGSTENFVNK